MLDTVIEKIRAEWGRRYADAIDQGVPVANFDGLNSRAEWKQLIIKAAAAIHDEAGQNAKYHDDLINLATTVIAAAEAYHRNPRYGITPITNEHEEA